MAKVCCFGFWSSLRRLRSDFRFLALLLLAGIVLGAPGGPYAVASRRLSVAERRKEALALLQRANNLMDIRLPGSAPFQMKVTFEALPAIELYGKEKRSGARQGASLHPVPGHPWVITGNGMYEETWLSPHRWRREVTFGSYHAVEVEANGVRKFQASSSYEPARVLMLVDRLLQPIRRWDLEPQLQRHPPKWKIQTAALDGVSYQRISFPFPWLGPERFDYVPESYTFLLNGALARSQADELTTRWRDYTSFGGKLIPQRISVEAMGDTLLTANVSISAPIAMQGSEFTLPGPQATPGMTMQQIHFQNMSPVTLEVWPKYFRIDPQIPAGTDIYVQDTVDRRGVVREYEVLAVWPLPKPGHRLLAYQRNEAIRWLKAVSANRQRPTLIDGYPCEDLSADILVDNPSPWQSGMIP